MVVTTTGTELLGAAALPVAVNRVDETTVVASGTPSNETTGPDVNPSPLTVIEKLPTATGDGLIDVIVGRGTIVTDELAVDVGEAVLAARTVTTAGFGTADGAKY